MYVVSWATWWTLCESCNGVTPAWWTNISAYKVPLLRVFLGRETFIILQEKERKREQSEEEEVIFIMDTLCNDVLVVFSHNFNEAHSAFILILSYVNIQSFE